MFTNLAPHMLFKKRVAMPEAPRYTCDRLGTGIQAMPTRVTITDVDGPRFFRPEGRDPLLWCFQIARGECTDAEHQNDRSFQREQALKADAVTQLRKVTEAKTEATRRKLADAESELCGRQFTRGFGLEALCRAYATSVLYVSGRTCCSMGPEPEDNKYAAIIRRVGSRNSRRHEVLTGDDVQSEAEKTKKGAWLLESWVKPLRAVSSYSITELRNMVASAGLRAEDPSGKRLKKSELHAALVALAQQN